MSKVAHYLQEHLIGEVMTSTDARRYFATDGSILQLAPALVAYPRNENDVRKAARFAWQLAERGRVIPVTARGSGTDSSGGALGLGISLVFPAHMNRILELDTKANTVTVEPGINYGKLQQTLHTHGRFLPPYPESLEYTTVGGAVATNASGDKSVKYGDTRGYVQGLRVVLANGEVIETGRISKRDLSKKLGLATFEGEIYRSIDTILEEQRDLVERLARDVTRNNAGYNLLDIKRRDGSFDLTPLFVGSQGTLGIITEVVLATEAHNPLSTLLLAKFDSLQQFQEAISELRELPDKPSALEMIDQYALGQINELNPNLFGDLLTTPFPAVLLFAEFDDTDKKIKKAVKRAAKIFEKYALSLDTYTDPEQQQNVWKLRQASSLLVGHNEGLMRPTPIIDDGAVPVHKLRTFMEGIYKILEANGLEAGIWGHAGDAALHVAPRLNLGQVGDRQRAFRIMDDYHKLVLSLGGTISAGSGDGRLRAPYLEQMYGSELFALLQKVKQVFDPYGILNPGVKFGTSIDDLKSIIRTDFGLDHLYEHLPRS